MLLFLWRKFVNGRIASHPADEMRSSCRATGQCGIKAIRPQHKLPFWKPALYFLKHLLCQFDKAGAIFAVKPHIDGESQRLASPGWNYPQCQHHKVESPAVDNTGGRRAYRISPPCSAIDLAASAVKDGIVHVYQYCTRRIEQADKHLCQKFPQVRRLPARLWKQAMVSVVRTLAFWFCKRHNACDSVSAGAQYPAGYQIGENLKCWLGKDGRKIQDYGIPCRCQKSSTHIGLREKGLSLPISSAGHFYFYSFS
jgi:hypothetical protein